MVQGKDLGEVGFLTDWFGGRLVSIFDVSVTGDIGVHQRVLKPQWLCSIQKRGFPHDILWASFNLGIVEFMPSQ